MTTETVTVTFTPTAEWVALPRREQLFSEYSDFYKDVHGIRPRWAYGWSEVELEEALDRLAEEAEVVFAEEDEFHAALRDADSDGIYVGGLVEVALDTYPTSGEGWTLTEVI